VPKCAFTDINAEVDIMVLQFAATLST